MPAYSLSNIIQRLVIVDEKFLMRRKFCIRLQEVQRASYVTNLEVGVVFCDRVETTSVI